MQFLKSRYKWLCGLFAFCLILCNCAVIYMTYFWDDTDLTDSGTAAAFLASTKQDQTVPALSDAVLTEQTETDKNGQGNIKDTLNGTEDLFDSDLGEAETTDRLAAFSKDDWNLILINKLHRIPEDYTFEKGYVETSKGWMSCDARIADDLADMLSAAKEEGITLVIISPYRSLARQKSLFNQKLRRYMNQGESYLSSYYRTAQAVTIPGSSEHQIGLAMDITSDSYTYLDEKFAETDEGKWLKDHCSEYGFILRYPLGKEDITGIEYEPWHFRYVGKEAAEYMTKEKLCLEEFLELLER